MLCFRLCHIVRVLTFSESQGQTTIGCLSLPQNQINCSETGTHYKSIETVYLIRYDTIRYDKIRYATLRYDTIRYDTIRCDTIRYVTIRYDGIRYDTIRYDTIRSACDESGLPPPAHRRSLTQWCCPQHPFLAKLTCAANPSISMICSLACCPHIQIAMMTSRWQMQSKRSPQGHINRVTKGGDPYYRGLFSDTSGKTVSNWGPV